jgi:hypothetical protein
MTYWCLPSPIVNSGGPSTAPVCHKSVRLCFMFDPLTSQLTSGSVLGHVTSRIWVRVVVSGSALIPPDARLKNTKTPSMNSFAPGSCCIKIRGLSYVDKEKIQTNAPLVGISTSSV